MAGSSFVTAQQVFDAHPSARDDMSATPTEEPLSVFIRGLAASATPEDSVTFCAYALAPREAVWWAAQCVRALVPIAAGQEDAALLASEAWVRQPTEEKRRLALTAVDGVDRRQPTTWLALAAAWATSHAASGHVTSSELAFTPKAVRTAVLAALALASVKDRGARLNGCVVTGRRMLGLDDPA
jgi:hypothetical protein